MDTCKDCKWWSVISTMPADENGQDWGDCYKAETIPFSDRCGCIGRVSKAKAVSMKRAKSKLPIPMTLGAALWTAADFGCIQWEGKEA